jgi:transcriptional regulator with XRE-family HTH domain
MKKKTVGEKIADLRKERKIQQDEFADMIGVSRQALSQWETGKQIPRADKIAEICEKFGVDGNYFYSDAPVAVVAPVAPIVTEEETNVPPMPEVTCEQGEKVAPMPEFLPKAAAERRKPSLERITKLFGVALAGLGALLLLCTAIAVFVVAISPNVNETTVRVWTVDPLAVAVCLLFLSCIAVAWVVLCLIVFIREGKKDEKK